MSNTATRYIAVDPATGLHVRDATPAEIEAYLGQTCPHGLWAFRKPVRVGDSLIDEYTGPGIWFGGAGF